MQCSDNKQVILIQVVYLIVIPNKGSELDFCPQDSVASTSFLKYQSTSL